MHIAQNRRLSVLMLMSIYIAHYRSHSASSALDAPNTAETNKCVFNRRPKLAMLKSGSRRSLLSAYQKV